MKNKVNRALVAKKNKFLSKSVQRGTRTIWRYLGALFLLFTFAIGNVWAQTSWVRLDSIDFTNTTTWPAATYLSSTADVKTTVNGVYFWAKKGSKALKVNDGVVGVDFGTQNMSSSGQHGIAIPVTGVNGSLKVIVYHAYNNTSASFKVGIAHATDNDPAETQTWDQTPGNSGTKNNNDFVSTKTGLTGTEYIVWVGENGSSYTLFKKVAIYTEAPSTSAPAITAPTTDQSATYTVGDVITPLSVTATGSPAPSYQWYSNASASTTGATLITGAESASYTPSSAAESDLYFYCVATNSEGSAQSPYFHVEVNAAVATAPSFTSPASEPAVAEYSVGDAISALEVVAAGYPAPTLQWYSNSSKSTEGATLITGAESASYTPSNAAVSDLYFYCVATNASGTAQSEYFHVTVAAVSYCAELNPATSGDEPILGTVIAMQTGSYGGSIKVVGRKQSGSFAYTANGLTFNKGGVDSVRVTLNHLIQAGTKFYVTVNNQDGSKDQGFYLQNLSKTKKADMHRQTGSTGDTTYVYTAVAGDGLVGVNEFIIARGSSSAALKSLKVSNCGAELLALSSAVNVAGKATVTLSKSLVAAGGTATASYSDLDSEYEFDGWEITSGDATIADATAATAAITMGTTASTITLKLKAAGVKYAVHFDSKGGSAVADQSIDAGGHAAVPTAPTKFKYTFGGWSETDGGSTPADLSAIAITAEKTFYAIWTDIVCPTSGTIYSFVSDGTKAPGSNTYCPASGVQGVVDIATYATVSGGLAQGVHTTTSNNPIQIQTSTSAVKLSHADGYFRALLECPLQEGDTIKFVKTNKVKMAFDSLRTKVVEIASGTGANKDYYIVPATYAGEDTIMVYYGGSSVNLTALRVIRPAKYAVTFNMQGHGTQVEPQNILGGGKVEEPATTDITGWDFGGWFTDAACSEGKEWAFATATVSQDTVLYAKWTEHVASNDVALGTLSVNGEAITIVPSQTVYAVELPFGTTAVPAVTATANDENVKAFTITQALAVDGSATIYVKAEDNSTEATYTINFSVATSKDIELVWDKSKERCDATKPDANVLIAAMSEYLSASYTGSAAEGGSLTTGKTTGSKIIITAKPGYAFKAMGFYGKIEDGTCNFYNDGVVETIGTSTGDACYANVFSNDEVHEFVIELTGSNGVYIRNMQLTIIKACTPIVLAWDEEPVEFEVGKAGYAIAATANNGGTITYASVDNTIIDANASTGALTIAGLGSVALSASTPEGDGSTYCANGGNNIEINKVVNTYYLVSFDAQNGDAADEVKYYSGDAAIALPAAPSYPGYDFQGWFDAETGGNQYMAAINPTASMTVYAQWVAQCAGASITTQPTGASYLTGRTPVALVCEATAGNGGALTYEWFTCDDELKTNPVAATAMPSTAVAGTFYYFCKVTEAGCGVEAFSDVVTITVADKDAICIIKSTPTSGTEADVDGVYQGNAYFNGRASDKKLNSKYNYVAVELADGYTFQAGDKVVLNQAAAIGASDITKFYVFAEVPADGKSYVTVNNAAPVQGDNWFEMPAELVGESSLYLGRVDASCNPTVGYLAVYRACAPILNKVTVNGAEGKPNALNQVVFEVAASTTQSQLEAIAFDWVSNDDAWTAAHAPVAANAWEFGVANTVTFTDKDGDQSVYTITVNKAAASTNVELATLTVDGNAIVLVPGQDVYSYEYPFGTAETPAPVVAATTADANATLGTISQAATKNGTATFTVTAEDGTTYRDYTINISVSRIQAVVIYDGSTMTDITTKTGSDPTGFSWSMGSNVASTGDNIAGTWQGKNYTHAIKGFKANANTNNLVSFVVPEDYMAKVRLTGSTNSNGSERKMFIAKEATNDASKAIENYVITSSTYDAQGFVTEYMLPGTYYLGSTDSYRLFEFSVQLYPIGYSRDVTEGRYGTICLPNGGVMVGAEIFEIAYYGETSKKVFLDNIPSGEMVAGRPYIFLPKEGATQLAVFYTDEDNAPAGSHNGLIGFIGASADAYFYIPDGEGNYILQNNLYREVLAGGQARILSNRAYIKLSAINPSEPALAPGRRRVAMGVQSEQVATGCENLNVSDKPVKMIIDGQLFILRGEKMYDAKGQLVK